MKKNIIALLVGIVLFSCKDNTAETSPSEIKKDNEIVVTQSQFAASSMQIGTANEQEFDVTVKTTGKIDVPPQNRAKVSSFIGGYIKSTTLLVGDKVTKGQALLTLENTEFLDIQKDYLEVAEQINYLKSEYNRQKTLYDEKITSQKNYLKAESEYRRAFGMYQSLKAKLNLVHISPSNVEKGKLTSVITVYSPISGDIVVMNANVGMYVAPSEVLLEIIETDHLHLELDVFEKDILKVREEQKIKFTVPEASKEVFNASVHLVGKSIEGANRVINVHGHLDDNIKQRLLTGMFVEANIITAAQTGLAIPIGALVTENNKNYVLVLEKKTNDYVFKKQLVKIGAKTETEVEIIPDAKVTATTRILLKGAYDITE
ncbi:efflux transporter periplasmic adaptor subunit [Flavobacterium faecale]|uniref:Efflux transporter periplasmic adaptor subunit n=1 Tax=Flavobacterium faecale TaxID=1355330 RepID=A0A2S1LF90_9FLAO|nr:efflux RND transporter periplasmic adaptor subunit [Flavobacterium faecale]AWG22452.1 efflux transporter periplasmic adaptor subunit [Flavobacterium faecale]